MSIFDPTLPIVRRGRLKEKKVNIKGFEAKTYQSWHTESGEYYSIKVKFKFNKEFSLKKNLKFKWTKGFYLEIKTEEKWIEIPYNFYTPDFYPTYWPINVVSEKDLNEIFELNIPKNIKTWKQFGNFLDKIEKNHIEIIKKAKAKL